MANDDDDYEIGYGKPPRYTRYRKGQSGNPRGRPPKKEPRQSVAAGEFDEMFREEMNRKYRVKDGDGTKELTGIEVVARAAFTSAAKGNASAQREILAQARKVEENEALRREAREAEKAKDFDKALKYRAIRQGTWDAAVAQDCEPDDPWPHPDDILIDATRRTWTVRGPMDSSDLPRFEYLRAERDAALVQSELAIRDGGKRGRVPSAVWDLIWEQFDAMLPRRWQLAPRRDAILLGIAQLRKAELRRLWDKCRADADLLRPMSGIPLRSKEAYKVVNATMKPTLRRLGYRSLAQFEQAQEDGAG